MTDTPSKYTDREAIAFLVNVFEQVPSDTQLTVIMSNEARNTVVKSVQANVTVSGFSEAERKKLGNLGKVTAKKGSVLLYGNKQPDFCLIIKQDKKAHVFMLEEFSLVRAGVAGSVLHLTSDRWKKAAYIDIYLKNFFTGDNAFAFFQQRLMSLINDGTFTARVGKWVSKKVFDKDLDKDEAERLSIAHAIEYPDEESIRTMVMGGDIERIECKNCNLEKDKPGILKVIQQSFPTVIEFNEMMIEYDTNGKEIGARTSQSTYVYLIGAPFRAPSNLIIIRHRPRDDGK